MKKIKLRRSIALDRDAISNEQYVEFGKPNHYVFIPEKDLIHIRYFVPGGEMKNTPAGRFKKVYFRLHYHGPVDPWCIHWPHAMELRNHIYIE
jgi:hypothetical protein